MTTIGVVQARFGSSRLPGKVLTRIDRKPMLQWVLERTRDASSVDEVVLATTTDNSDDAVAELAQKLGFRAIRGSTFDVLDRFHDVLKAYREADTVVRVTADCPFLDPKVIDGVVSLMEAEGADFAANRLPPPFRRTYPVGLDTEACTRAALEVAWSEASARHQREHVMPYLYENRDRFRIALLDLNEDMSSYRWTVDTHQDLVAVRAIARQLGPDDTNWRSILEIARRDPRLQAMNSDQEQKTLGAVDERWMVDDANS